MNKKEIRIIYLGTPEISARVLENLIANNYNIVAVISQEDKPVGRKQVITATPVKKVALEHAIPVFQPHKIRENYSFLDDLKPDILLTMAYGQLIPVEVLQMAKIKALNLHGSLLPKYRGASPIQASLFNGDKETGVTLMEMVEKMDAGNMFYKTIINIDPNDNYDSLCEKISIAAFDAFDKGIENIINNNYQGEAQNESDVSITKKIKPEDQLISFNSKSCDIINKIRALTFEPGAYFIYKSEKIKIQKAILYKNQINTTPGKIFAYDKNNFLVETSDGIVSILMLQKPGKKSMPFKDFYNGNREMFKVGEIL